jgi:exodeoxyribonuclease VII small subunit
MTDAKTPKKLTYEESRARLLEIVSLLEEGGISLEDSIKLWTEGDSLAKECKEFLESAKQGIEKKTSA